MPRSPIARRRLAGTAVALLVLFASPWPRGLGVEALLGRLLAAWHRVGAAVEEPPGDPEPTDPQPTDPQPTDPQPTDPAAEPGDPQEGDDRGPSIDPIGNSAGGGAAGPPRGAHP